ncbi:hypothetical protein Pint_05910 [Pistacia integerrima]|uniref:Uncharacterized protein n=1 Tax=Pistacia integerrima TaxID=434235 RepID=A0ACC0Z0C3_9ROSI|nr:hypothetical protein Pint_05910 [Pistacia integerrima]
MVKVFQLCKQVPLYFPLLFLLSYFI